MKLMRGADDPVALQKSLMRFPVGDMNVSDKTLLRENVSIILRWPYSATIVRHALVNPGTRGSCNKLQINTVVFNNSSLRSIFARCATF